VRDTLELDRLISMEHEALKLERIKRAEAEKKVVELELRHPSQQSIRGLVMQHHALDGVKASVDVTADQHNAEPPRRLYPNLMMASKKLSLGPKIPFSGVWDGEASSSDWEAMMDHRGCSRKYRSRRAVSCCNSIYHPNYATPLERSVFKTTSMVNISFDFEILESYLRGGVITMVGDEVTEQVFDALALRASMSGYAISHVRLDNPRHADMDGKGAEERRAHQGARSTIGPHKSIMVTRRGRASETIVAFVLRLFRIDDDLNNTTGTVPDMDVTSNYLICSF
jgi:hypothetical protein